MQIIEGAANRTLFLRAVDNLTGQPKTGLAHSSVACRYVRAGEAVQSVTLAALAAADADWSAGGWFELSATYLPGIYRMDVPDAAFAAGAGSCVVCCTASGVLIAPAILELVSGQELADALLAADLGAGPGTLNSIKEALKAARAHAKGRRRAIGDREVVSDWDRSTDLYTRTCNPAGGPYQEAAEVGPFTLRIEQPAGLSVSAEGPRIGDRALVEAASLTLTAGGPALPIQAPQATIVIAAGSPDVSWST